MSRVLLAVLSAVTAIILLGIVFRWLDERSGPVILIREPIEGLEIVVSVSGAIATPGVYRLPEGSRFQDIVTLAGGVTADADLGSVNMARRVYDEDSVRIPALAPAGERPAEDAPDAVADAPSAAGSLARLMDLNTASASDLETLPGVGEVLAGRIVDARESRGGFQAVDDLDDIEGISPSLVEELRPLLTVGP